jgi:hypothetical protein
MLTISDSLVISNIENAYTNGNNYITFAQKIVNDNQFFEEYKNIFNSLEEKIIVTTKDDALMVINREYRLQCLIIGIGLLQLKTSFEISGNKEIEPFIDDCENIYKDLSVKKIV